MGEKFNESKLPDILFTLRNTPCTEDGIVPSQLLFSFKPADRLEKLKPGTGVDTTALELPTYRDFAMGSKVIVSYKNKKLSGTVSNKTGNVTYNVSVTGAGQISAHANQMKQIQ